jgi:hypothetical protein
MIAPDMANPAPTNIAMTIRGSRISNNTIDDSPVRCVPQAGINSRFTNRVSFLKLIHKVNKKVGKHIDMMTNEQKKARIAELKMDYIRIQEKMENMELHGINLDNTERQLIAIEEELKQLHAQN